MGERAVRERTGTDAEQGSALLLFPAGVLILLVLAALSFDLSLAFQRKRELVELADSAANDAVTFGLDEARLRADGAYCLHADRVARSIAATLSVSELDVTVLQTRLITAVGASCPTGVALSLATKSPYAFGQAVPGMPEGVQLVANAASSAVVR